MGLLGRKRIALASSALFVASFASFLGAEIWYSSTRPQEPHLQFGRIYPHHLKGCATVYLTASEATGLSLLPLAFFAGFLVTAMNYPRERNSLGVTVEWTPTKLEYRLFWLVILSYTVIITFAGPILTHFAVSHGVIMTWATDHGS